MSKEIDIGSGHHQPARKSKGASIKFINLKENLLKLDKIAQQIFTTLIVLPKVIGAARL